MGKQERERAHFKKEKFSSASTEYGFDGRKDLTSAGEFVKLNLDEIMKGFESLNKEEAGKQKGWWQE